MSLNLTEELIDQIYNYYIYNSPITDSFKEKLTKHNIKLSTIQDKHAFNIKCLSGENLCLKGASRDKNNPHYSVYISFKQFWSHIFNLHIVLQHGRPYKIWTELKKLNIGYPGMHADIRIYLMIVCPTCAIAHSKFFQLPTFSRSRYNKICESIGQTPTDPKDILQPKLSFSVADEFHRGRETAMPLSFIVEQNPTRYIGEPLFTKPITPSLERCHYHIVEIDSTLNIEYQRPLIFSPYINHLNTLPLHINYISMDFTVPELFQDSNYNNFNSMPLFKTQSFVFSIGLFNNIDNINMPLYLIIVVDINDIIDKKNHYILNTQPLLQHILDETLLLPNEKLKEFSKKKLIEYVPFIFKEQ
ncbi:hypothetical protein ACTFIU_011304 [Dictyostelium citrinum]